MSGCEVNIKVPVQKNLVFDFECDTTMVRFSISDAGGIIKLAGPLGRSSPHNIDVSRLGAGNYTLKIVDGDVWGNTKFEKKD